MTDAAKRQWAKLLIFVAVGLAAGGWILWDQAEKDATLSDLDIVLGNPPPPAADHTIHVVMFCAALVAILSAVILFSSSKAEEREEVPAQNEE